jgi:arylformamidase
MKMYDISMEIHPHMLVFPGNPAPRIEYYKTIEEEGINESSLFLGMHTGTHVDARLHIDKVGSSVVDLPLESFYGPCVVLDLTMHGREIKAEHLENQDIGNNLIVLLKTENSLKGYDRFREDYAHLTEDGAAYLAQQQVKTVGVDYLSVEPFNSGMKVHHTLVPAMTVFEGLDLRHISAGTYIFVGLPLRIRTEGAPARAILVSP